MIRSSCKNLLQGRSVNTKASMCFCLTLNRKLEKSFYIARTLQSERLPPPSVPPRGLIFTSQITKAEPPQGHSADPKQNKFEHL